ncbi:WD-40 repeat protein [Reticulomyxa filosa]|uniref:WD-40 repeat protein n=1 Tax=Reticulomyxa filosa TaxID=46433 RepID=X6NZU1_RETFI|nr:WD-40 repeat protein [Reticulomyxa filosa]|eukprot:ETO31830.1 WD-40 repeat protein [Reticulomyxa filosa]
MGNPISKKASSTQQSVVSHAFFALFNDKYLFVVLFMFQGTKLFMLDVFRSSSNLLKTFTGHNGYLNSIDCLTLDCGQFICSGSADKTVRIWNVDINKQIQSFNGHSNYVYCAKFSQYYHYNNHRIVVCSSANDKTIRFWDIKDNQQLQVFNGHQYGICSIEFSPFNGGRYLCSGSFDNTTHLWDVETSKSLHIFRGHSDTVRCVDISPLQSNNNSKSDYDKNSKIGLIGGNGYTICSGSFDKTICVWDIETTRQFITFRGHEDWIRSVKYGSNELINTILSGSNDSSVRLWDIRSGQQIQMFNGHTNVVNAVEFSPFVVSNIKIGGHSNVICSGSIDNTIRFWDIRSNKIALHIINGDDENDGIMCLKFVQIIKNRKSNNYSGCDINLYYGSKDGSIHIWG